LALDREPTTEEVALCEAAMNDIADDATAAAVAHLMEQLDALPADRGRIAAFFALVIRAAIESAIVLDRQRRTNPSDN
jgi:hypothetical protein